MALTRYTQPLPDYEPSAVRYLHRSLEVLYIFGCIRKPYTTRKVEVLHTGDAEALLHSFGDAMGLYSFLWNIYDEQSKLKDLVYNTKIMDITTLAPVLTRQQDLRLLIKEQYLHAERATTHGSPYLVASKSITNLLRLIDAGPLPRLTNADQLE